MRLSCAAYSFQEALTKREMSLLDSICYTEPAAPAVSRFAKKLLALRDRMR
jgi:hypothetical protein